MVVLVTQQNEIVCFKNQKLGTFIMVYKVFGVFKSPPHNTPFCQLHKHSVAYFMQWETNIWINCVSERENSVSENYPKKFNNACLFHSGPDPKLIEVNAAGWL